ncbi:phenylalanine--tRNA ligase subunit beta [Candidatus Peregrinibacteria bacterium CG_4_10_14_0_2_um_filter_38_24]|nr:MAG: phenylalanine--tRNA ligase subunit beta [Candidatus Peregrinibacteria bacterium CG_4_10_14_0_2_um_filter_38_24]PJC39268.1 MAG: phenylalanine--tRNA ligase subunit beta [Candidatus Peregrinibacteria bacterium CG_4_9_14_0_2_um_filter_38_9]
MLVSLNWLKDFVELPKDADGKTLGNLLTLKTAEVDHVIDESADYENIIVGQIIEITAHPNADKLKVTKTSIGKETLQIVCGGENIKEGMYVAVACLGAKVKWHGEGEPVVMEKAVIRGVESYGMICASIEIGLNNPDEGTHDILDLSALKPETGTPIKDVLHKDDIILEFDNKSLTHRPDLWGHMGIAREVAAITNSKFKPIKVSVKIPETGESVDVKVKDFHLCPRYCGLIINNIKIGKSPDWLAARLKTTGHGIHNNIVDVTNYVMMELGQPLHAFDKTLIQNGIVVRTAKKNEKIRTLDGKEYNLDENMLVIADSKKPVAVAGIIGGEHSGINENTTAIILESANFNHSSVRKTSTKLGVRTDSVQRFEKGLDPLLAETAILRATELILQICPEAKIAGPITDIQKFNKKPLKITLDLEKAKSKIGADLSVQEMKKILESLEFKVTAKGKKTKIFIVEVPTFRATKDVLSEDDLIEEIARIYGYDNIEPTLPSLPAKLPLQNNERTKKHRARELFSYGFGFDEVYNYSFYGLNEIKKTLLVEAQHLKLQNYLSEEQTNMVTSLTPNILKNLQENVKNFSEIRIYEIGHTYLEIGQYFPLEEKKICGAILIKGKSDKIFYEAKGCVEAFIQKFNLSHVAEAKGAKNTPYAHPIKSLTFIDHSGKSLATCFMLHPTVQKNYDLEKYSIALFEINFTEALKLEEIKKSYKRIPKFPNISFDISVAVDKNVEIETLKSTIKNAEKDLISDIKLFDIYEGDKIESDKKAVAFSITIQSEDRTLTDAEMAEAQSKIFTALENLGGKIRGKNY